MAKQTVADNITRLFLKSVGVELGFYNASTQQFIPKVWETPQYQANLEIIQSLLKKKWKARDLEDYVLGRYKAGERKALISEIMPSESPAPEITESTNLIQDGETYRHPSLYDRGMPSYSVGSGGLVSSNGGFVRQKSQFTLGDLLGYYYNRMKVGPSPHRKAADLGAMRYLLKQVRLDALLHSIDIAADEERLIPILGVGDFLSEGEEVVRNSSSRSREYLPAL